MGHYEDYPSKYVRYRIGSGRIGFNQLQKLGYIVFLLTGKML